MNLVTSLGKILLEDLQSQIQQIKEKYVGEGKPMSEKDFQSILDVTNNKFYLISWLAKKVGSNIIKTEDIYKWKEYFDLFEKNKNKFPHKDIHLYKNAEDVKDFLDKIFEIREGGIKFDETQGKENFVSQNEIEKLESTDGIKYLGVYDNENFKYQVFQVFGVNKEVWKLYRDILGRCKGRDKGAKIDICTIGHYSFFKDYLTDPKGSSYFLLYNLDDPKSPYQLHYESGQFMDKNDNSRIGINQLKFFEFVGGKVPQYSMEREDFPGDFQIPVKGKGTLDDKKRKQGLWKTFRNGGLEMIATYYNDEFRGPFVEYNSKNKIITKKGSVNNNQQYDGKFESYQIDGKLDRKGVYNNGKKIGIWYEGDNDGVYRVIDYSNKPIELSGFTKSGKLRYVGFVREENDYSSQPYGNVIYFYPSGTVNAIGKKGVGGALLGDWTFYFPDGSIKSQGKFLSGKRTGIWNDFIKTKEGKKLLLVADFENNWPKEKVKVYDQKGNFLSKVKPRKIEPIYYWNFHLSPDNFKTYY